MSDCNCIGLLDMKGKEQIRRVYGTDACSPALNTCGGGQREVKIAEPICLNSKDENGKHPSLHNRVYDPNGVATACTTSEFFMPTYRIGKCHIRKLTPRECWRLMGFDDDAFFRARYGPDVPTELLHALDRRSLNRDGWKQLRSWLQAKPHVSESQLYKQAGNSIVVDVLMAIFRPLCEEEDND